MACDEVHKEGHCRLKLAGVEHCGLCGIAHYGHGRTCPHLNSEALVAKMIGSLKQSTEPRALVDEATKYLRGIRGDLVRRKKMKAMKDGAEAQGIAATPIPLGPTARPSYTPLAAPSPYLGGPPVFAHQMPMPQSYGYPSHPIQPAYPPQPPQSRPYAPTYPQSMAYQAQSEPQNPKNHTRPQTCTPFSLDLPLFC
jgi:hypothetical protein